MNPVDIDWLNAHPTNDRDEMRRNLALYAIVEPRSGELVYLGKVDGSTVRARWSRCGAKAVFWDWYERAYRTMKHALYVGTMSYAGRLTRQLVADVESLLIYRLQPSGNVQSKFFRITRPGLQVRCLGDWPGQQRNFLDR